MSTASKPEVAPGKPALKRRGRKATGLKHPERVVICVSPEERKYLDSLVQGLHTTIQDYGRSQLFADKPVRTKLVDPFAVKVGSHSMVIERSEAKQLLKELLGVLV